MKLDHRRLRKISLLILQVLIGCTGFTEPDSTESEVKTVTAKIEYDWMTETISSTFYNYNVDQFYSIFSVGYQDEVNGRFTKTAFKTGVEIQGISGSGACTQPTDSRLFTNDINLANQMALYAGDYRQLAGNGNPLYPYHMLSVKKCDHPVQAGYSLGFAIQAAGADTTPAQRNSRAIFIFYEDIKAFAANDNAKSRRITTWATAHEIGHSVKGLMHTFDRSQYHDASDYCIMDYYGSTYFDNDTYVVGLFAFCNKQDANGTNSCCDFLRRAVIRNEDPDTN